MKYFSFPIHFFWVKPMIMKQGQISIYCCHYFKSIELLIQYKSSSNGKYLILYHHRSLFSDNNVTSSYVKICLCFQLIKYWIVHYLHAKWSGGGFRPSRLLIRWKCKRKRTRLVSSFYLEERRSMFETQLNSSQFITNMNLQSQCYSHLQSNLSYSLTLK